MYRPTFVNEIYNVTLLSNVDIFATIGPISEIRNAKCSAYSSEYIQNGFAKVEHTWRPNNRTRLFSIAICPPRAGHKSIRCHCRAAQMHSNNKHICTSYAIYSRIYKLLFSCVYVFICEGCRIEIRNLYLRGFDKDRGFCLFIVISKYLR